MPREASRRAASGQEIHLFVGEVTDIDGYHDESERFRQLARACAEDLIVGLERLAGVGGERPLRAERRERPHREIGTASSKLGDDDAHAEPRAERVCVERAPYTNRAGIG